MTETSKLADMIEKTGLAFANYASSEVNLGRLLYDNEVIAILSALRAEPLQPGALVAWRYRRLGANALGWIYEVEKPNGPSIHLFELEPLYAAPIQSSDGLVDASHNSGERLPNSDAASGPSEAHRSSTGPAMTALLPCPFCGSEAEFERKGDRRASTIVSCTSCGATQECGEEWDHGRTWNTRVTEPLSPGTPVAKPPEFRSQVFRAAERANARFGQWMPQRWLEIFIGEMMVDDQ